MTHEITLPRPAVTIRILGPDGNEFQRIEIPAIEAERLEFDETFADDDSPNERN
jgi:hypothetical protein